MVCATTFSCSDSYSLIYGAERIFSHLYGEKLSLNTSPPKVHYGVDPLEKMLAIVIARWVGICCNDTCC